MCTDSKGDNWKRGLAPWRCPKTEQPACLNLLNSLTREKEKFVPMKGNRVCWYICGPTVYDSAHMGHARSYVSFDILRRVLESYFGYDVQLVMNVTDIDDKIIKRARQRHLVQQYVAQPLSVAQVLDDVQNALRPFDEKLRQETNPDKKAMMEALIAKVEKSVGLLEEAIRSGDEAQMTKAKEAVVTDGADIVAEWLDRERGASVSDLNIFTELSRHFENEFHSDMASLEVLPPDLLTRVSEYVPEIVDFIQRIIDKGLAYQAGNSVYFDTKAFDARSEHHYGKLQPEAVGDLSAVREGEGELSQTEEAKRDPSDFALWKGSKAGEPSWPSPWGLGRPGWHIECSVMASAIFGQHLDIHSGGFDLKFPHHDNEIAQSEAYFGHDQWSNYWLHAGTLRISGLKMSKSLKNFITIREALQHYTARQLRLLFLLHNWTDVIDYSEMTMGMALCYEKVLNEFFLVVKHVLRTCWRNQDSSYPKMEAKELELDGRFQDTRAAVHTALCDSVDTRAALAAVKALVADGNAYLNAKDANGESPNPLLLRNIANYLTELFRIFGVIPKDTVVGFQDSAGKTAQSNQEALLPYVNAVVEFRETVREMALKKPKEMSDVLSACDKLRNETLPNLGVRLEDKHGQTVVKLVSAEELQREQEIRQKHEERQRLEKEKKAALLAEKEARARLAPEQLFRSETDKYSQFDATGMPTHDIDGKELGKKQLKKLEKIREAHAKKHKELMERQLNGAL